MVHLQSTKYLVQFLLLLHHFTRLAVNVMRIMSICLHFGKLDQHQPKSWKCRFNINFLSLKQTKYEQSFGILFSFLFCLFLRKNLLIVCSRFENRFKTNLSTKSIYYKNRGYKWIKKRVISGKFILILIEYLVIFFHCIIFGNHNTMWT